MKQIRITDTTVSQVKGLTFKEKLFLVRELASLHVDAIALGALSDSGEDKLFIKTAAPFVSDVTVIASAGKTEAEAHAAWEALAPLAKKRLAVPYPVSVVQMEYFCHAKPEKVLELIRKQIAYCASLGADVEFVALDATRSEEAFLSAACAAAKEAGATYFSLCDSEGVMTPLEFTAFLENFAAKNPDIAAFPIDVAASDELSMACANSIAALSSVAGGVKTTMLNAYAVRLDALVRTIALRGNDLSLSMRVDSTAVRRALGSMPWLSGEKRSGAATAVEAKGEENEILLGRGTTVAEIAEVISHLGYVLTSDDIAKIFEQFEKLVERKAVSGKELETIIADVADEVPPTYVLRSYIVNSGDRISPMAQVEIEKDGEIRHGVSIGDGPIDAAFLAVERVIGTHYELDDFRIASVTRGQEAMGEALVRLRSHGRVYSGTGASTDIIGASLKAYVNALNKIVFEER
jgi:2-isopropylmalate synthase